jgi:cystathionine gamma-synthase
MPDPVAFSTRAAHAGRGAPPQSVSRPLVPPIYQSSVYAFDRLEDLEALYAGAPGHIYYRQGTPTHAALEAAVAALEGAEAAVAAASGMAIATAAVLALASAGDRIVADRHAYGGTYTLLADELPRLGIDVTLVDATDLPEVERALEPGARALLIEALSNPTLRVADVPALCALGRARGVPVLVDATFASPALLRPVEHGATLAWHSVAKYLGGHSAAMGGVAAGERGLVEAIRAKIIRLGACQGVMDAWLTLLGLPTLPLRMAAHTRTARAIAAYLAAHPAVARVYYPGLPDHPGHELAGRLYPDGCGGMLSFDLRGGEAAAHHVLANLRLIAFAPSLADVTTTVSYPFATSHVGLPDDVLRVLGVGRGLIRLSAGIEEPSDVIADLERALGHATA